MLRVGLRISITIVLLLIVLLAPSKGQAEDDLITQPISAFPPQYTAKIYSGYLNITYDSKAFHYFFFESQNDPNNDPVILWMNGGPGCSSLMGWVTQNGPFVFQENSTSFKINEYAWNKQNNVIYLESPSSVGFSVGSASDIITNDSQTAKDNLIAMVKFFEKFPNLKANDFYIAGESYAGVYIPMLAQRILDYNDGLQQNRINIKGILIGNACTHPLECYTSTYYSRFTNQFFYTRGFYDRQQYETYLAECQLNQSTKACINIQKTLKDRFLAMGANIYNIYGKCFNVTQMLQQQGFTSDPSLRQIFDKMMNYQEDQSKSLKHPLRCSDALGSVKFFNTQQFRGPMHLPGIDDLKWTPCSDVINYTIQSSQTYTTLPGLVKAGLRIFYFSGDVDAIVPITGTLWWFDKYRTDFGTAIKKHWRPWVTKNKDQNISGMIWELQGLTFASVIGAGHMVPTDKPQQAKEILDVFLGRHQWTSPDDYIEKQLSQS